jgi:hypothetical protein
MIPHPAPDPLGSIQKQYLDHLRRMQEGLRCPGDAGLHPDLPSITEVLTIQQFGFPRSYNLNDGLGPDLDYGKSVQSPERD